MKIEKEMGRKGQRGRERWEGRKEKGRERE